MLNARCSVNLWICLLLCLLPLPKLSLQGDLLLRIRFAPLHEVNQTIWAKILIDLANHKGGCIWNVPTFSVITPQSVRIIKSRSLIFLCFKICLLFTELKQTKENEFYKHKYCFAHAQYTSWFWTDLFLNCYLNYLLHGFYIGHENLKILKNHIL